MLSFSRKVKEEIVFNEFDHDCSKAILCALLKTNGTLMLGQGLSLLIRTENAKIASKMHKLLKELYAPSIEFKVKKMMKLKKNNVYLLKVSKAREILEDLHLLEGLGFTMLPSDDILYDDITAGLLVSEIRRHRQTLFEELQLFYRVFVLKEDITLEDET